MSREWLGCCGAYCRTCEVLKGKLCKGCKTGYDSDERDLAKAKCKIKVCCISEKHASCADCGRYDRCATIRDFLNHKGYKYGKYKEAIDFIRKNGYAKFFKIADRWKKQYGKYD